MYEVEALAAVIIMFVCILCIIPLNQIALKWCVLCSNVDLTVFYTNPRTTVPDIHGIFEYLYPDFPRSGSFFLCYQTTLQSVHCPPFQYSALSTQLGLGVNPNPADFLNRGILVTEWTQIRRIFWTAVYRSRSEPKSRVFSQPRYFGLGLLNPNPVYFLYRRLLVLEWTPNHADFLNRGILVSECWTRIPRIF